SAPFRERAMKMTHEVSPVHRPREGRGKPDGSVPVPTPTSTPVAVAAALACVVSCAPLAAVARDVDSGRISLAQIAKGSGGFAIEGIAGHDLTGYDVASAGDVNGDGLDDLIVGAPATDQDGHSNAGRAFVVFGRTDTSKVRLEDVAAGVGGFALNG